MSLLHPIRTADRLPEPARSDRWQPLRAGLIDLFYYDAEEFRFHDGRLLLRGNNGTGKSKVLALLLPFLLDGDLSPHRVEPDADPKKRMEWNLLLGGEHPNPERVGYTWLEFGRRTEDGGVEYRTLGCGIKAVSGRGIARHWYVVTSRRVGADLHLLDGTRTALSRERLVEAVTGHGAVYDRARDYRRAVDEALFGLGEQRYGALVDLLVHLRQPQLSKRPSEKALSDALTEAFPPLDQAVVADVAEAFRSLESDRDELAAMVEARDSARGFLDHYRRYAAVATRRRAAEPRQAESRHRRAREELAAAEQAYRTADDAAERAAEAIRDLDDEIERLRAREQDLRTGPEMRTAEELERLGRDADRRESDAAATERRRVQAATERDRRQAGLSRAQTHRDRARAEFDAAAEQARQAATTGRLAGPHREVDDILLDGAAAAPPETGPDGPEARAREVTARAVARQERALTHVRSLLDDEAAAQAAVRDALARVDRLDDDAAALTEQHTEAAESVQELGEALVRDSTAHLQAATELRPPDVGSLLAALELWVGTLTGANPVATAADESARAAAAELVRAEAAIDARIAEADRRAAELDDEIARLAAGEHEAPPRPHTRSPDARTDRDGAPLWQLVDFADDVGEDDRAGLEAALEAAGVLDAWLSPDGVLHGPDGDALLAADPGADGPGLTALLHPAVDREDPRAAGVDDAAVAAVLRAVAVDGTGAGPGGTRAGTDGRFGIGVLRGSWHKDRARYIGRGAREAARRARLEQLRTEAATLASARAEQVTARDRLVARRATLSEELAGLPTDGPLRGAHATLAALAAQRARLAGEQDVARARHGDAVEAARVAGEALVEGAADVGLPAERDGLDAVRGGLGDYRVALAGLWPAARAHADAADRVADAGRELADAEESLRDAAGQADDARRASVTAREAFESRRETVGDAVEELWRKLSAVTDELAGTERGRREQARLREEAVAERGRAEGLHEAATAAVETAVRERAEAAASLRRFARTGLIAVAVPGLEVPGTDDDWAPDPAVRLARQIEQDLGDTATDDGTWDRVHRRVNEELKTLSDTLSRHGNQASAQLLDDGIVVEIVFGGRPTGVAELVVALNGEVASRQELLDAREREILENHLINEVAGTLQELISDADRQVSRMNGELAGRPTSTGMLLRLEWRAREDGPAGLAEARRRLLRQTSDAWSVEDRSAVGSFLQERIAEVRARDESGTWLEHLTTALDYRSWHRFAISRQQNGQWRSATGPASGGERVLAASVPLFAAASAHYASAGNPHAPRLVTLDEAFAGVDDNARAKYLGLLAAFDLDVVMTSEREWGCYPEVPGLAIAQLSRADGVPAVLVTNWRWDGHRRERVERPAAVPAPRAPSADPAPPEASLFDEL